MPTYEAALLESAFRAQIIFFTGPEIGDDTEADFRVLAELTNAELRRVAQAFLDRDPGAGELAWVRFAKIFVFPADAPATLAADDTYKVGLRFYWTRAYEGAQWRGPLTIMADKLMVTAAGTGARPNLPWRPSIEELVEGYYGDYTTMYSGSQLPNEAAVAYAPSYGTGPVVALP